MLSVLPSFIHYKQIRTFAKLPLTDQNAFPSQPRLPPEITDHNLFVSQGQYIGLLRNLCLPVRGLRSVYFVLQQQL